MQYIALNGYRHAVDRYFTREVRCVYARNWTQKNASEFAKTITSPTTLIGFSDGATAAMTIASENEWVQVLHAHSPMYREVTKVHGTEVNLYRTVGDKSPTFEQTARTRDLWLRLQTEQGVYNNVGMYTLAAMEAIPIRSFSTLVMWWTNHQFHNCLPYLPQHIVRYVG
jgi:alpha/beta superfamily hydrolase